MPVAPFNSAPPRPGSQSALRAQNQQRLLEALTRNGALTQAELSRLTGLSTATVSNIIKRMSTSGLIRLTPITSSGRRAFAVHLVDTGEAAVGIDFGRRHLRVVVANLSYEVLAESTAPPAEAYSAETGMTAAYSMVRDLLEQAGRTLDDLTGVGVGIPGPLDSRTGRAVGGTIHPEWVGVAVREDMEALFGVPVYVDNDCNLGALAEVTWGDYRTTENLAFVKIGTGIGSGLVINGQPFRGKIGVTGEIGHTTLDDQGSVCRCGNRGCLETVASTKIMLDLLRGHSPAVLTTQDIVRLALKGDAATLRVIDDTGQAVGRALGTLANLINPEVIVVGGPLSALGEVLVAPVRRGLIRYAIPVVGESTTVAPTSLGDRAEALGAATLVIQSAGQRRKVTT
ncbi:ROK family transcriptional regulator [Arthrobacter roseus]|uniref:ROK family transcriptional regulator n=1 Tax=Arthrobacter roseus TaxID=136274 RepID=UPI001966C9B3|nr:ROK family transcriptional regulator [Arthrobacter roseus]MBM7847934.1 putative NBD/HSP70 family sugar kinase [Arthrobacter roseus]